MEGLVNICDEMDQESQRFCPHRSKERSVCKDPLVMIDLSDDAVTARAVASRIVAPASDGYVDEMPGGRFRAQWPDFIRPRGNLDHGVLGVRAK
jgi:hypothetical protein